MTTLREFIDYARTLPGSEGPFVVPFEGESDSVAFAYIRANGQELCLIDGEVSVVESESVVRLIESDTGRVLFY